MEFGGVNRLAPVADWASCIVKNTQEELKTYDPTEVEFGMYFPEVHLLNAVAAKTEGSPVHGLHRKMMHLTAELIMQDVLLN